MTRQLVSFLFAFCQIRESRIVSFSLFSTNLYAIMKFDVQFISEQSFTKCQSGAVSNAIMMNEELL